MAYAYARSARWMTGTLAALALLLGAAATQQARAEEVVNFGVQPATMPIYIARAAGLLDPIEKKHKVKIVFKSFSYGAPENQALAAGELQIASAGMGPAIVASARLPACPPSCSPSRSWSRPRSSCPRIPTSSR
ncbi:MAG: hypothetical protein AB7U38_01085 [Hyphomicrobiales bacterium]